MSLLDIGSDVRPDEGLPALAASSSRSALEWAQAGAMLAMLVVWARVVTVRTGGRDAGSLVWGCLSVLPALLAVRPSVRALAPLLVLVSSSFAVCMWAPYAFSNGQWVGEAAYSGAVFAVVRTYAGTAERRRVVACALALVSLDQFAEGFLAWWGGQSPYRTMLGTFYWHNQFGAFMLPGLLLGGALAVYGRRIERAIGFICAPICATGLLLSASRASMLAGALGLVGLLASCLPAPDRRTRLRAGAALVAAVFASFYFFTSPLFFPHWQDPFGTSVVRNQQALSRSTSDRLDFWGAAVAETVDRPVVGGGFGSFGELSTEHLGVAAAKSTATHNGVLQAFADGGLTWGLPVLLAVLLLGVAAVRKAVAQARFPGEDRAVAVGAGLTALALLEHSGVDFDWQYPSLAIFVAAVAGLVFAVPARRERPGARTAWAWPAVAVAAGLLVLGAQLSHAHDRATRAVLAANAVAADKGSAAAAASVNAVRGAFYDPRIDQALLEVGVSRGVEHLTLPAADLQRAADRIRRYAEVNDDVAATRAFVLLGLGRGGEALRASRAMTMNRAHVHPASLIAYAVVLAHTGSERQAQQLLAGTIVRRSPEARHNVELGAQLYALYLQLRSTAPRSLELRCAGTALQELDLTPLHPVPLAHAGASDACAGLSAKGWP